MSKFKLGDMVKVYDAIGEVIHIPQTSPQQYIVLFLQGRQSLLVYGFDLQSAEGEPGIIKTSTTHFEGGSYYRQGDRIYIQGAGAPAGILIIHSSYRYEAPNTVSYKVEGWTSRIGAST